MKPLFLTIEGLQSFQEKQEINFEKISKDGIFGIFGPTGSGKSTIIDGITLALYGTIMRFDERSTMSQEKINIDAINKNSDNLKIDFKFKIGNNIYRIERNYKLSKKTGKINKSAILFKLNDKEEKIAEGHREIYKEITENILGLTLDDFTRSVILPQGNFNQFLKLSGNEKREMLERIFNLEKYGKKLTEKVNTYKDNLEKDLKNIDKEIENIGFNEEETKELNSKLIKLEDELLDRKKEKENLSKQIKELEDIQILEVKIKDLILKKEKLISSEDKIKELVKKRDLAHKFLPILEKNDLKEKYDDKIKKSTIETKEILKELKKAKDKLIIEENNYNKKKLQEDKLFSEKNENYVPEEELEKTKKIYDEIYKKNDLLNKKHSLEKEIENILKERKEFLKEISLKKEDILILENEKKNIFFISNDEILFLQKQILENKNIQKIYFENKEKYMKLSAKKETYNKNLNKKKLILENKKMELEEISKNRKNFLIYELEKEIKKGEPCPICGNEFHKENFHKENISFNREKYEIATRDIDEIKKDIFSLEEKINAIEEDMKEYQKSNLNIEELEKNIQILKKSETEKIEKNKKNEDTVKNIEIQLKKYENKLNNLSIKVAQFENSVILKSEEIDKINLEVSNFNENNYSLNEIEITLTKLKEKRKKFELIDKKLIDMKKNLDLLSKNITEYNQKIKNQENYSSITEEKLRTLIEQRDEILYQIKEFLKINNINDFSYLNEIKIFIKNIGTYEKTIQEYENQMLYINKSIIENKKILGDKKFIKNVYENITTRDKMIKNLIENNIQKIGETKNKIQIFIEKEKLAKEKLAERLILIQKLDPAKEIFELLKGRKFIEFLSAGKLQIITKIASNTLQKMTNGRYRINVDEKSNFSIIDNFSSTIRKPQSLSGGETFIVSLCLALALASEIQLRGKSKLEFFFLDEGFGTLDSNFLEIVFNVLENLKSYGMTVGIITHVEELKNRIPKKLIVKPAKIGISGTIIKEI